LKETLNLLPIEVKAGAPKKKDRFYYLLLGLTVYIIVIISLWTSNVIKTKRYDAEIDKLNKQKVELQQKILPPPAPAVLSVDREILDAMGKTPKWSRIISDISVVTPDAVWLSSIESSEIRRGEKEDAGIRQMSVKGFSTTQLGVASLISALEASQYFYDVEIVFSQKGEKDISFELKTRLRWT